MVVAPSTCDGVHGAHTMATTQPRSNFQMPQARQTFNRQRFQGSSRGVNSEDIQAARRNLPIFSVRRRLLQEINARSNVIIIGETGSGKTTQIPQYLFEVGLHKKHIIACTQPRRVAAITVAQRVSQEKGTEIGHEVGYSVRFDDMTTADTRIKYMTDGMLLREAILDPLMKRYSIVILDEAHERTIHTDVLFGIVKKAQKQRASQGKLPLKIIVMSATMDVDHFSEYFNKAPVLYLEGRQYPIELMYTCEPQSDYIFSALVTVFKIHQQAPPGHDILVFLTGQEEIESMVKSIRDIARSLTSNCPQLIVCPMYAALPNAQQLKIFQPTPKGARKVILATNIAETSVTIRGIKSVVDAGMVKAKSFNPVSGLDLLKVQRVSQAQAWQRTGRAGRECAGKCYRLYTEDEFEALPANTVPEIQRCHIGSVVLQLLALGISDIVNFDFMDKPPMQSIIVALDQLHLLGAVEKKETIQLTEIGKQMAAFPLEPKLSKVLLVAKDFKCLEEMLTIVALLSAESVVHTPHNKQEEANAARRKFVSSDGDHVTLLNIYKAYKSVSGNKQWCFENFINGRNMKTVCEVRGQLREICVRQKLPIQSCGHDTSAIRHCLTRGFFQNAAELQKEGEYVTVCTKKTVSIHPSSALFRCKPACIVYNELVQTSKTYMRDVSVVDPDWLFEAAPSYFKRKNIAR